MKYVRILRLFVMFSILFAVVVAVASAANQGKATSNVATTPFPKRVDWWQNRHKSLNERIQKGNVDLIFIGDSITQGWEGSGKKIWDKYYGYRNAVNLGIRGDQTSHVLWRLDNGNINGISPKLAIVMMGTNNAASKHRQSPEQIAEGVKAILGRLQAKLPNTKILLLAIFPRGANNNDRVRQITTKVNALLAKMADGQNVFYLDIGDKFLRPDGTLGKDIMSDLVHPTSKGYAIWAKAIEPRVKKLMDE